MAVGFDPRTDDASAFQNDLAAQQEIAMQMEQEKNMARRGGLGEAAKDFAREQLRKEGREVAKKALQTGGRAAARIGARYLATTGAAAGGAAVSSPVWITIGVIIAVILFVLLFIVVAVSGIYYACNQSDYSTAVKVGSKVASWFGYANVCEYAVFDFPKSINSPVSDLQQPTQAMPPAGSDLVAITGVPVEGATDARLRPCMLDKVQIIYTKAKAAGIDFVITSALRPGAVVGDTDVLSAHGRGEAVDIALRPRGTRADPAFMKLVRKVVQISEAEGFRPSQGDTLDEYSRPTVAATGGHIHIEYNLPRNGGSYCTNPGNSDS